MVKPASPETRAAAYRAFDPLWQRTDEDVDQDQVRRMLARSVAYEMLARELKLPSVDLSTLTEKQAREVPAAVMRIKQKLDARTNYQIMEDYKTRGKEIAAARRGERVQK